MRARGGMVGRGLVGLLVLSGSGLALLYLVVGYFYASRRGVRWLR